MSRNLCDIGCHECPGGHEHIVIEGPIRPVTEKEDPAYYRDHAGLLIAEARCVLCHALYFAWVDWPSSPHSHWRLKDKPTGQRFCDLSFRHAFNDEPAIEDTPLFEVEAVVTYVRRPVKVDEHSYRRNDYGDELYRARKNAELERWKRRQEHAVELKLSPADELARVK